MKEKRMPDKRSAKPLGKDKMIKRGRKEKHLYKDKINRSKSMEKA